MSRYIRIAAILFTICVVAAVALTATEPHDASTTSTAYAYTQVSEWQLNSILRHADNLTLTCADQERPDRVGYRIGLDCSGGDEDGYEIDLYARYTNGDPLEDELHLATLQSDGDIVYNNPPYSNYNQIAHWTHSGGGTGLQKDGPQLTSPNCQQQYYNNHQIRWGAATSYSVGGDTYTRTFMKARIDLYDSCIDTRVKPAQICFETDHCGTDVGFFESGGPLNWVNLDAEPYLGDSTIEFYRSLYEK